MCEVVHKCPMGGPIRNRVGRLIADFADSVASDASTALKSMVALSARSSASNAGKLAFFGLLLTVGYL